jgi:hypothetical protein
MADPFTWLVGAAVTQLAKMVINKQVDYAMLQQFKEQYEQLPDKRRRPGPKLRSVAHHCLTRQWGYIGPRSTQLRNG